MPKKTNPYIYEHDAKGKHCFGYRRKYKGKQLRARGFLTAGEAEQHLNEAMSDVQAVNRGEYRGKPTTAQDALDIYRRKLEVRARDKGNQYGHNVRSNCKVLQDFVTEFGATRLVREITETDLREFYQRLCFRPTLSKNSAAVFVGRVQGMLKAAQEAKPDLVNWLRPKLAVKRKTEFERRVVEDWEYRDLVLTLLNPPPCHKFGSRKAERLAIGRDAADAVRLLRQTGGRLNEILRLRLDQFHWRNGFVRLEATKTENERDIPLWGTIQEIVQARIRDGLTGDSYLFARATTPTYDNAIARACRNAGRVAKLNYGQAHGFTCHSFRHTAITHWMEVTGNDAGSVMKWSGHKTLESFSVYLRPRNEGRILATQAMTNVDATLTLQESVESVRSVGSVEEQAAKPLQDKQVAL
jgi:integrase